MMISAKNLNNRQLESIYQAAREYNENLLGKTITFFRFVEFEGKKTVDSIRVNFKDENFAHLVGLRARKTGIDSLKAKDIFEQCVEGKLDLNKCLLTHRMGKVQAKLDVVNNLMDIGKDCFQIGDYDENFGINIVTHGLANSTKATMGVMSFFEEDGIAVPNSVLNEDLRETTFDDSRSEVVLTTIEDYELFVGDRFLFGKDKLKDLTKQEIKDIIEYVNQANSGIPIEKFNERVDALIPKEPTWKFDCWKFEQISTVEQLKEWHDVVKREIKTRDLSTLYNSLEFLERYSDESWDDLKSNDFDFSVFKFESYNDRGVGYMLEYDLEELFFENFVINDCYIEDAITVFSFLENKADIIKKIRDQYENGLNFKESLPPFFEINEIDINADPYDTVIKIMNDHKCSQSAYEFTDTLKVHLNQYDSAISEVCKLDRRFFLNYEDSFYLTTRTPYEFLSPMVADQIMQWEEILPKEDFEYFFKKDPTMLGDYREVETLAIAWDNRAKLKIEEERAAIDAENKEIMNMSSKEKKNESLSERIKNVERAENKLREFEQDVSLTRCKIQERDEL